MGFGNHPGKMNIRQKDRVLESFSMNANSIKRYIIIYKYIDVRTVLNKVFLRAWRVKGREKNLIPPRFFLFSNFLCLHPSSFFFCFALLRFVLDYSEIKWNSMTMTTTRKWFENEKIIRRFSFPSPSLPILSFGIRKPLRKHLEGELREIQAFEPTTASLFQTFQSTSSTLAP